MKKRILLVVDNEEWALGNIAYNLKENLKEFYDINVVTLEMFKDNIVKIMILSKKYDLIHFLWRGHIYWLYSDFAKDYIKNLGYEFKEFSNEFVSNNIITTTICDHLFLTEDEEKTTELILSNVKNYIVTSQKLKEIYNNIPNIKSPKCVIHDGVDLNMFYKKKEGRKDNNIRTKNPEIIYIHTDRFLRIFYFIYLHHFLPAGSSRPHTPHGLPFLPEEHMPAQRKVRLLPSG